VRGGYLARMRSAPDRFVRVDASLERHDVERQVADAVRSHLDG
jgi:thymidylate kinase